MNKRYVLELSFITIGFYKLTVLVLQVQANCQTTRLALAPNLLYIWKISDCHFLKKVLIIRYSFALKHYLVTILWVINLFSLQLCHLNLFYYLTVILSFMKGFASKLIMTHPTRGISFVFPSIQSPCNMAEK